jgi:hypothetical protein
VCDPSNRPSRCSSRSRAREGPAFALVRGLWWACQDLNLGPHPYQQNSGNRCACRRPFPQVTLNRRGRSYALSLCSVMCSHRGPWLNAAEHSACMHWSVLIQPAIAREADRLASGLRTTERRFSEQPCARPARCRRERSGGGSHGPGSRSPRPRVTALAMAERRSRTAAPNPNEVSPTAQAAEAFLDADGSQQVR